MLRFIAMPSHQLLAACILLALFIASVVYEAIAMRPQRQWLALACGLVAGIVMFLLLLFLLR